jgi:5-methylthioadenosine/S-adenosylhomocysteine deaminase
MTSALCLAGGTVVTVDGDNRVLEDTDVWVREGRITHLLSAGSPAPWPDDHVRIDALGQAVMPGMVNAHSHSPSALQRARGHGETLDMFVMRSISQLSQRNARTVYVSAAIHAAEMLKSGITGVIDHLRHGLLPTVEAVDSAFKAYLDTGIRATVAPMFEDRIYLDSLPIDQSRIPADVRARWRDQTRRPPIKDYFEMMDAVRATWSGRHERLGVLLGVDGPQRCTPALLEMTGDYARRHNLGLHTHLLEAKTQALVAPQSDEGSFVALLHRYGLIGPKTSLAHFVWCTPRDMELAAELGVNVVHNPASNLFLGSGVQPTARLLELGAHVALGSDGTGYGRTNLFEQVRLASLLSRIADTDSDRWIDARRALRLATVGGGRALRQDGLLGSIIPGARADLVTVRLAVPAHRPPGDLFNELAMYETGAHVDTVVVDGQVVVRSGRLTTIDEAALLAEAEELAIADREANAEGTAAAMRERAIFQPLILEALRRPLPLNRFVGEPHGTPDQPDRNS